MRSYCVCADYVEYFICEEGVARSEGCKFSPEKGERRWKPPRVEVPRRGRKGVAGKPTSSRLADKVGRMGG